MPTCPECGSRDWVWRALRGRGCVYAWVTVHQALDPIFEDDVPYSIAVVEMEEGPRFVGRLLENDGRPGMPVTAEIYRVDGQALLGFRSTAR